MRPLVGLRLTQTDTYVVGSQSYRTDIQLTNAGAEQRDGILYRAGDCYLQGDDSGFVRVDSGAPACIVDPAEGRRIEQWTPLTPGSHFFAGPYGEVWSLVGSQQQLPDRCTCDEEFPFDNGAGLSWPISVAPGQTTTISHETFFSPQGRGPVTESFTQSVPAPTEIVLDPVIVAQSVAIAAGVILLVPFPSALFNSTLEENYDEVMAGVGRIKAWVHRQAVRFRAWIAGLIAARRQPTAAAPTPPADSVAPVAPMAPVTPAPDLALAPASVEPPISIADPTSRDVWRTPLGMVGFVLLSALLYAFLDPTFGFSLNSLATYAGLVIGLFVVLVAYGLPLVIAARGRGLGLNARALPATLIVAVACVLISRLANFQPGYLYGLVVGFFFAVGVKRSEEGRAEGIAAATSLAVALIAWVLLAFIRGGNTTGDAFVQQMLSAATVTVVVAGLENAVFAMLPLQFLPGCGRARVEPLGVGSDPGHRRLWLRPRAAQPERRLHGRHDADFVPDDGRAARRLRHRVGCVLGVVPLPTQARGGTVSDRAEQQLEVDAPREAVFVLLATADGLRRWLDAAEIDPRVGGELRVLMREAEAVGKILAFDPPQHISFTWQWTSEPAANPGVVAFDAIDHGARTHVTVRHVGLRNGRPGRAAQRAVALLARAPRRRHVGATRQGRNDPPLAPPGAVQ